MSRWNALIFVLACLVLASCDQPLTGPEAIAVTGVELDSELLELSVGDAYELAATVLPHNASNQQVEWSSSDSEIATVTARGTVTAVNEGTARITAMTDDGATPVLRPIDRSADPLSPGFEHRVLPGYEQIPRYPSSNHTLPVLISLPRFGSGAGGYAHRRTGDPARLRVCPPTPSVHERFRRN